LDRELTAGEKTTLDGIISGWTCPPVVEIVEATIDTSIAPDGSIPVWNGTEFEYVTVAGLGGGGSNIIQITFAENYTVANKWIPQIAPANKNSNEEPFIVPFDMTIKSISFVNDKRYVDTDIQIWRGDIHDDFDEAVKIHTSEIRDARSAVEGNVDVDLVAGDKVAVYLKDRGTNVEYPIIILWAEATDTTATTFVDNFDKDAY
jgi:hypothetical protein